MQKQELREQLKQNRQKLSRKEVEVQSEKILQRLLEILDLLSVSSLHAYLPLKNQNEVDTHPLLELIWRSYPNVKTARWSGSGKNVKAAWLDGRGTTSVVPQGFQFDIIIVPVLGFDKNNHRLGFGGGFYDRFLASQPKATKIGLAYQQGLITSDFSAEAHDVKLDAVITEARIYK